MSGTTAINVVNPVTGEVTQAQSNEASVAHAVDDAGLSLGKVLLGTGHRTPEPPAGTGWTWNFESSEWVHTPTPREQTIAELATLDAQNHLTQRNMREFILLTAAAIGRGEPANLMQLPGIQRVAAVEAQAAQLRSQIT